MTIAAGFNFNSGVLLCADTKHSAAYKIDASKIFAQRYDNGIVSAFAYAGHMGYCRMTIQHFEQILADLKPNEGRRAIIRAKLEAELEQMYRDHLYSHPGYQTGGVQVQFLAALWCPVDGLFTISMGDTSIAQFRGYDCIGAGEYLGHYLIRTRYKALERPRKLEDIVLIAASTLAAIKGYDDSCGGESELIVLRADGNLSPVSFFDITKGEVYARDFEEATRILYFALADPRTTDAHLAAHLHAFQSNLKSVRRVTQEIQGVLDTLNSIPKPSKEED